MAVTDSSEQEIKPVPVADAIASPTSSLKAALSPLFAGTGGIDSWILEETNKRRRSDVLDWLCHVRDLIQPAAVSSALAAVR